MQGLDILLTDYIYIKNHLLISPTRRHVFVLGLLLIFLPKSPSIMSIESSPENGIPYGQRSLNAVIESTAAKVPEKAFGYVITSLNPINVKTVTFSNLLNAIHQASWLIESSLGSNSKQQQQQQSLWYTGTSDLRYFIFALAASRTGHKVGEECFTITSTSAD